MDVQMDMFMDVLMDINGCNPWFAEFSQWTNPPFGESIGNSCYFWETLKQI